MKASLDSSIELEKDRCPMGDWTNQAFAAAKGIICDSGSAKGVI